MSSAVIYLLIFGSGVVVRLRRVTINATLNHRLFLLTDCVLDLFFDGDWLEHRFRFSEFSFTENKILKNQNFYNLLWSQRMFPLETQPLKITYLRHWEVERVMDDNHHYQRKDRRYR